jgi:hypothetical protein
MTTINEAESYEEFIARAFYDALQQALPPLTKWEYTTPYIKKAIIDKAKKLVEEGIIKHA